MWSDVDIESIEIKGFFANRVRNPTEKAYTMRNCPNWILLFRVLFQGETNCTFSVVQTMHTPYDTAYLQMAADPIW